MLDRPVESYDTVAAWESGLRTQWGGNPFAEDPVKLRTLVEFCEFVARDPDAVIAFCFLRKRATGERFQSKQRRDELLKRLKEFEIAGSSGIDARRRRSHVVSFLSHNGVLIY